MDLEFLGWLSGCGLPFAVIFTKIDKVSAKALAENTAAFMASLAEVGGLQPETFTSSSKERQGRSEILGFIASRLVEAAP